MRLTTQGSPRCLRLEVSDDGAGLEADPAAGEGEGLAGIHERARLLGGTVELEGDEPRGLLLIVTFPVPEAGS